MLNFNETKIDYKELFKNYLTYKNGFLAFSKIEIEIFHYILGKHALGIPLEGLTDSEIIKELFRSRDDIKTQLAINLLIYGNRL
jgi:hypothetical protein